MKIGTTFVFTRIIKVMRPESTEKFLWDIILFTTLVVNIFYVPLKVGFDLGNIVNNDYVVCIIMERTPGIILVLDILINFNKGFYSHGYFYNQI